MPVISLRATSNLDLGRETTAIPADLIATASICLFLTIASVCARVFTKAFDLKRMQIDDCKSQDGSLEYLLTNLDIIVAVGVCSEPLINIHQ